MEIALAIVIGILSSILTAAGVGFAVWQVFRRKIVDPKVVFGEEPKQKIVMIPGEGIFAVQKRRPCKHTSDELEWVKEQRERENS